MKKGFTLVELIAVIVILATVSMIVFPNINAIIFSSRQTLHDNQIKDINKAAEKWATDNMEQLDKYHLNTTYISLSAVQATGYLEKENITDPLNKEEMNGCIQIKYNITNKKYEYNYEEKTCEEYAISKYDETLGYIIYEYDAKEKKLVQNSNSLVYEPTGLSIYNYYVDNNMIYADGEVGNGLYEFNNEYVFRGSDVNNYVSFAGKTWRILSINKKDYSMKLIGISPIRYQFDSDDRVEFRNASIKDADILKKEKLDTDKILTFNFETDMIDGSEISRTALASILGKDVTSLDIGSITILDYVNASATLECSNNYLSSACKDNNYLYTMFAESGSTWTLNNNGSQVWYIDTDGILKLENASSIKYLYPVIQISSNTYITNEAPTGSNTSALSMYQIK